MSLKVSLTKRFNDQQLLIFFVPLYAKSGIPASLQRSPSIRIRQCLLMTSSTKEGRSVYFYKELKFLKACLFAIGSTLFCIHVCMKILEVHWDVFVEVLK